jgi:hypothetical protein
MIRTLLIIMTMATILSLIALPETLSTVYAGNEENEQDDKRYVDELCDASEDYEANKKECDKLYNALEEDAKDDINSFEDGIISKETYKEDCEEDSGTWVDGECDLDEEQS